MARQYSLKLPTAREIVAEVQRAVAQWREVAGTHGLSTREITRMASAFEHEGGPNRPNSRFTSPPTHGE